MMAPSLFVRLARCGYDHPLRPRIVGPIDTLSWGHRQASTANSPVRQAAVRVAHVVDRSRPRRAMVLNDARGDHRQHDDRLRHRVSRLDGGSKRLLSQSSWPGKTRTIVATVPTTTTPRHPHARRHGTESAGTRRRPPKITTWRSGGRSMWRCTWMLALAVTRLPRAWLAHPSSSAVSRLVKASRECALSVRYRPAAGAFAEAHVRRARWR